jgi:hypothetical protein
MEFIKLKQFVQRNHEDKVFFHNQVAGLVHHIGVATYSLYLLYYSCQNEKGYYYPSEKGGSFTSSGKHFGWLRDEVCMMEINKGYTDNVLFSCAFMFTDIIILKTQIKKLSVLNM